MLLDEKEKILTIVKSEGLEEDIVRNTKVRAGQGIAGKVVKTNKVLIINDAKSLDSSLGITEYDSFISIPLLEAPLRIHKNPIGVINITNKEGNSKYTEAEASIVSYIADTASIAINNQQNVLKLYESYLDSLTALANAMESKDSITSKHCGRMVKLALIVAEKLDMSASEKETLKFGAILHDIGKIGIKEAILMKPGKLTIEEYDEIKKHVDIGANIIKPIKYFKNVIPLIRHHHERYDGNGYPKGLKGEDIPLGARIICVIDAFDAMTSDRPYHKASERKDAISELKKCSGTQFDPKCVDILIDYLERKK